jgi:hypothetical protein
VASSPVNIQDRTLSNKVSAKQSTKHIIHAISHHDLHSAVTVIVLDVAQFTFTALTVVAGEEEIRVIVALHPCLRQFSFLILITAESFLQQRLMDL